MLASGHSQFDPGLELLFCTFSCYYASHKIDRPLQAAVRMLGIAAGILKVAAAILEAAEGIREAIARVLKAAEGLIHGGVSN